MSIDHFKKLNKISSTSGIREALFYDFMKTFEHILQITNPGIVDENTYQPYIRNNNQPANEHKAPVEQIQQTNQSYKPLKTTATDITEKFNNLS